MMGKFLTWVVPFITAMAASLAHTALEEHAKAEYQGYTAGEWAAILRAPDEESRHAAAVALAEMGAEARSALPELIDALEDADPEVRRLATRVLGNIGPDAREVSQLLTDKLMEAEDPAFARDGVRALHSILQPAGSPKKVVPNPIPQMDTSFGLP